MFENPRRGRQATNLTKNDPKILDLKSSSEQIFFRKLSLGAPVYCLKKTWNKSWTHGYNSQVLAEQKSGKAYVYNDRQKHKIIV